MGVEEPLTVRVAKTELSEFFQGISVMTMSTSLSLNIVVASSMLLSRA